MKKQKIKARKETDPFGKHAPVRRERGTCPPPNPEGYVPPEEDLLDCFWKAHAAIRRRLCIIPVRSSQAPRHANAGTCTL